jgi:hypothetical protein
MQDDPGLCAGVIVCGELMAALDRQFSLLATSVGSAKLRIIARGRGIA